MMVHILSGQWPFPSEAVQINPKNPYDLIAVSEIHRREQYINVIDTKHPLMTSIQCCLSNSPSHRPTTLEVHQQVSAMAAEHRPSFANRLEMLERIKVLGKEKNDIRIETDAEIALLSHQLLSLQCVQSDVPDGLHNLQPTSSSLPRDPTTFQTTTTLMFSNLSNMPSKLDGANVILSNKNVYAHGKYYCNGAVFRYSFDEDMWQILPAAPVTDFALCCFSGKILVVGGKAVVVTSIIHEFDEAIQQWIRSASIPSMPTARSSATAVSWSSPLAVIVCGGKDQSKISLTTVEVYLSMTSQWHTISPIPFPRSHMMYTVISNSLFLVGGESTNNRNSTSICFCSSIPEMLNMGQQPPREGNHISTTQWFTLPNTPNYCSGVASLGGCLLAIGGQKKPFNGVVNSTIHAYSPSTSSWIHVGDLPKPHTDCGATTLPSGEILVIGGEEARFQPSETAYKCSIIFK